MNRVIAFSLACLMLVGSFIPQNDLAELSKLPQLVEHYHFHHSVAGGGLSLAEFLVEHYGTGEKAHFGYTCSGQHQQEHQGLPLHGHHACDGHMAFLLLSPTPLRWQRALPEAAPAYRPAAHPRYPAGQAPALLQPPRLLSC